MRCIHNVVQFCMSVNVYHTQAACPISRMDSAKEAKVATALLFGKQEPKTESIYEKKDCLSRADLR